MGFTALIVSLHQFFVSLPLKVKYKRQYDQLFTDRRTDQELRRFGSF